MAPCGPLADIELPEAVLAVPDNDRKTPAPAVVPDLGQIADQAGPPPGLAAELFAFVRETGKWWLVPILLGLLIIAALVALSSTAAGPFVYTLF